MSQKIKLSIFFSVLIILFSLYFYFNNYQRQDFSSKTNVYSLPQKSQNIDLQARQIKEKLLENNDDIFTESTVRVILDTYLLSKKNNDPRLMEKELNRLADSVLKADYNLSTKDDLYLKEKINLNEYKKQMQNTLSKLLQIKEYELDTIGKIVKFKDEQAYTTLAKDIVMYKTVIDELKKISVDKNLLIPHLQLINSYEKLVVAMELIIKSKNDIILLYPALKALKEAQAGIEESFNALKWYLELNDHAKAD